MGYNTAFFKMKNIFVLLVVFTAAIICNPVMGQNKKILTKKEQKAIAREQLQLDMQREREMQAVMHQMRMDSLARAKAKNDNAVTTFNVPCLEASYDDEDFFRDYGIGNVEGGNEQLARERAFQAAKDMIKQRLGEYVQGMTDYFLESYSSSKSEKDAAGNRARTKLNAVVEGMINDAKKICERPGVDMKGNTKWYICIEIPKKELNDKLKNTMSEDEKLRRDFDADQMQKFMDERMQQMLEAKKNAGY